MNEWLEEFEELLDEVINNTLDFEFEEFRQRVIERLEEVDQ